MRHPTDPAWDIGPQLKIAPEPNWRAMFLNAQLEKEYWHKRCQFNEAFIRSIDTTLPPKLGDRIANHWDDIVVDFIGG